MHQLLAAYAARAPLADPLKRHTDAAPRKPNSLPDSGVRPTPPVKMHNQTIPLSRGHHPRLRRRPRITLLKRRATADLIRATSGHTPSMEWHCHYHAYRR